MLSTVWWALCVCHECRLIYCRVTPPIHIRSHVRLSSTISIAVGSILTAFRTPCICDGCRHVYRSPPDTAHRHGKAFGVRLTAR